MSQSNSESEFVQAPLGIHVVDSKRNQERPTPLPVVTKSEEHPPIRPVIVPRTQEEIAEDLLADQGHIDHKRLPQSSRPRFAGGEPVLTDIKSSREIADNLSQGLPASFSHIPHPDPRNRQGERTPWWRGSSKRGK